MKKNKKSKRKQYSTPGKSSGSHLFPIILALGIFLSSAALIVSLLVYFQPDILTHLAEWKQSVLERRAADREADVELADVDLEPVQSVGGKDALTEDRQDNDPSDSDEEREIGNVSDLDMEAFPTQEGVIYTAVLDTSMGPMVYYSQGDARWADYLYGGADPMKKYGCGPSAVAMLISSFTLEGANVTPTEMADWSAANGFYAPQGGSYHSLIPQSLAAYGLRVESVQERSAENVKSLLQSGHIMVALMGKGTLTENGHFILITRVLDNGYVSIADPNRYENSKKDWELGALLSELKRSYDSGGPLWAVSVEG